MFEKGVLLSEPRPSGSGFLRERGIASLRARLGIGLVVVTFVGGCAAPRGTIDPVYFPPPPSAPRAVHLLSFNSLDALVPLRPSFAQMIRGAPVAPYVDRPAGLAYRDGHLYICDTGLGVVHDWNLATGEATRIGRRSATILAEPVAVAVGSDATVYVADTERHEVVAFDPGGRSIGRFAPPGDEPYRPTAVAIDGSKLYVTDIARHRIHVFDCKHGGYVTSMGRVGSALGQVYFPMGVAACPDGGLYVSDMMNARVQHFDAEHRGTRTMGQPGNRYGDMGKPRHLAVGPDEVIFVADAEFAHVHLFDREGRLLMLLGGPDDRPGGTPMPVGVAVAETLPANITAVVPGGFEAAYFLFVANSTGSRRIGLFAIGVAQ